MITLRKSADRGTSNLGWLDSRHSFSFGRYIDRDNMGFRSLRVINDDVIGPAGGFGMHPHDNMEIISYVVEGAIEHQDSLGNGSILRPGEVQRMTAGTGIMHSEFNPSKTESLRLLQIWIQPEATGLEPSYEQRPIAVEERRGELVLIASRDGRDASARIHQDASVYAGRFAAGDRTSLELADERHVWIQIVRGQVKISGDQLDEGDALAISNESELALEASTEAEVLVFELA